MEILKNDTHLSQNIKVIKLMITNVCVGKRKLGVSVSLLADGCRARLSHLQTERSRITTNVFL